MIFNPYNTFWRYFGGFHLPFTGGAVHHHPLAERPHPAAVGGAGSREPDRLEPRLGKSLMKQGKIIGKSWDNHRNIIGK